MIHLQSIKSISGKFHNACNRCIDRANSRRSYFVNQLASQAGYPLSRLKTEDLAAMPASPKKQSYVRKQNVLQSDYFFTKRQPISVPKPSVTI